MKRGSRAQAITVDLAPESPRANRQWARASRGRAKFFGQPLRLGAAGFYSRQDYGFGQNVDSWAAMSDIEIPLSSRLSLSGKLYRGRALGGLNGGIGTSAVFSGPPATAGTEVRGLELSWRLDTTEIPARQQMGAECSVRDG